MFFKVLLRLKHNIINLPRAAARPHRLRQARASVVGCEHGGASPLTSLNVNKIILRELNADQDCRGGNTPEVVFAGCAVRDEIFKIMEDNILSGLHLHPYFKFELFNHS